MLWTKKTGRAKNTGGGGGGALFWSKRTILKLLLLLEIHQSRSLIIAFDASEETSEEQSNSSHVRTMERQKNNGITPGEGGKRSKFRDWNAQQCLCIICRILKIYDPVEAITIQLHFKNYQLPLIRWIILLVADSRRAHAVGVQSLNFFCLHWEPYFWNHFVFLRNRSIFRYDDRN